jgi:hypothetical protein
MDVDFCSNIFMADKNCMQAQIGNKTAGLETNDFEHSSGIIFSSAATCTMLMIMTKYRMY